MAVLNINGYRFFSIEEPESLRLKLLDARGDKLITGSILLAQEGINLSLAGSEEELEDFTTSLHKICGIEPILYKRSYSTKPPFKRFWIKVKNEIVTMGRPGLPLSSEAPYISAKELRSWFSESKDFVVLDARKHFEYEMGHFKNAISLGSIHFRDFPERLKELEIDRSKPVVTYCTGGIRCEKAAPLMKEMGFENVYQLDGGILRYFEDCGGEHWEGNCFVFDHRAAVDAELETVDELPCRLCGEDFSREFESEADCGLNMLCLKCLERERAQAG